MTTRVRFFCAENSCDNVSVHADLERIQPSGQSRTPADAGVMKPPRRTKIRPESARPVATFAIGKPEPRVRMIKRCASDLCRQPLGCRGELPYNVVMTGQFNWRGSTAPSLADIQELAEEAYARLPERFRKLCDGLVIQVEDFPTAEVLDSMRAQSEFDLLGLFQGVGLPFQSEIVPELMPNMIWLYRRPILDYWAEHEDSLGEIVTHVLVHEIGHHFGMSDEDMEAIEAAAE
jgi:predicted Zn-dependent protease with MMP-like domain